MSDECGNCKFWIKRSDFAANAGGGYCRRYPPSFQVESALNDGWPMVHQQSWCGEFTPNPLMGE